MIINKTEVIPNIAKYGNNRLSIQTIDKSDGCPYARLTVNLVEEEINEGEAFLDTNNIPTVLTDMISQGLCSTPIRYAQSGFCLYPLVKIDVDKLKELS